MFADIINKIARSSGKVWKTEFFNAGMFEENSINVPQFVPILLVLSTSSMLLLDQRTLQIKYRVPASEIYRMSLSPYLDDIAVFHVKAVSKCVGECNMIHSRVFSNSNSCVASARLAYFVVIIILLLGNFLVKRVDHFWCTWGMPVSSESNYHFILEQFRRNSQVIKSFSTVSTNERIPESCDNFTFIDNNFFILVGVGKEKRRFCLPNWTRDWNCYKNVFSHSECYGETTRYSCEHWVSVSKNCWWAIIKLIRW